MYYLCPVCGEAKRKLPVKGVLWIYYDYKYVNSIISKYDLLNTIPGSIWKYPFLLPLNYEKRNSNYSISSVAEDDFTKLGMNTSLYKIYHDDSMITIFDDTLAPTLSFKDRASVLVCLKAKQLGLSNISVASTGNAGASLAGICSRLNLNSHIFVPESIPKNKRLQIQSYTGNLYLVNGSYDDAFDLCHEISDRNRWYNRNTAFNSLTIEGKKSAAYDIYILNKGKLPDIIFVPVGDGVVISGLYKGFWELYKLGFIDNYPKLIGVQSDGSDALVRYNKTDKFEFRHSSTIADSICASAPRNLYMASEAVKSTDGIVISVSDDEILTSQKLLSENYGILCEPSAAASLAGYLKLKKSNNTSYLTNVMLLITGHGLKDTQALEGLFANPDCKSYDEWLDKLKF
ncbi:pyridoxal-phosphate dependent enzyme [Bacteroidota bacterium]